MNPAHPMQRFIVLVGAVATLAATGGCERQDPDSTPGREANKPVPQTQKTADATRPPDRSSERAAGVTIGQSADTTNKSRDIAITAEIKSELSKDQALNASAIDVDTAGGSVVLRGSTPDTAVRQHAAELARSVAGVTVVDNQLLVQARN